MQLDRLYDLQKLKKDIQEDSIKLKILESVPGSQRKESLLIFLTFMSLSAALHLCLVSLK